MNKYKLAGVAICAMVLTFAGTAKGQVVTYGNVDPFDAVTVHSANYVIGIPVEIPVAIQLNSFGMIYGDDEFNPPPVVNAFFGLYTSDSNGEPADRIVSTNSINLSEQQTYDNIAFTSSPTIQPGTYWMMGLYDAFANPRVSREDPTVFAKYFPSPFSSGMPANVTGAKEFTGQDFNYWINGTVVTGGTVTVSAGGFTVENGSYASGGLVELSGSDNLDLSVRRSRQDVQSRVTVSFNAVSPTSIPSSVSFSLESSVFARSTVNQNIDLFNYNSLTWEQLDTRAATRIVDQSVAVEPTGDMSRFVQPGTLQMQARIRYVSPVQRQAFAANIDQIFWTIGQ